MQSHAVAAEFLCPECERVFASGDERCPYDGTRLVNLGAGLAAGTVIDQRYTIKRLLGKGGMGSVYVARQHSMDRDVAIKIMHHRADGNHASVQRFFWEVRAARRLQNQHTITVFDFGQTERGSLYLAMELLKGTTLGHRLSIEERLSPAMAVRVGMQVCRSLEEAHGHGIIHRDLKPENIFLSVRSGQSDFVKVLDFGVAKFLDPDGQVPLTQTGTVFGTPRYMSPEQANSEQVDARSDLYALGILMYEMIAGKVPFAEDNPLEILYKHVHTKPVPLAEAAPLLADPRLSRLVDQLLAKRREDRPASAAAVRAELDLILQDMPDAGPPLEILPQDDIPPLPIGALPPNPMNETRDAPGLAVEGTVSLRTAQPTPSLGMRGLRKDGGTSRLVGRKNEQQRARKALDDALRLGTSKFCWVGGETGLGKRRFARWLAETAVKEHRATIVRGLSAGGIRSGFAEMRAAFDDLLGTGLLERAALRQRIEEHPAFSDRIEPDLIDALVVFLRPPISGGMTPTTSPGDEDGRPDPLVDDESRRTLFSALHRLLQRMAKIQPLLMDFGLLNNADPMTLRFLEFLAATLPQTPTKIAIVGRVDTGNIRRHQVLRGVLELVGWRGAIDANTHELVCLQRLEGAEFLELAQAIGRGFGHLAPYLAYLSGGNPADATELVEAIEQNPEHLRMARTWNPIGQRVVLANLPSTLIDRAERVLLMATDKLESAGHAARPHPTDPKDAQAVMRHAALLGVNIDVGVLEKALERSERSEVLDAVEGTLESLVATGCMHEDKGSGKLRFDSGVLRELILSQIRSPRTMKKLHGVIAETIETLPDRDQRTLELAAHWEAAEEFAKALDYRLVAARRSRAQGHKDEAVSAYAMALETHAHQGPATRGDAAEREILLELGRLRFELGSFEQAAESFRALAERATARSEQRLVADAELGLAEVQDALAEYGAASDLLKSAADRFRALNLPVDAARCELRRAASLERRGQIKAARDGYEAARRVFAQHQDSRGLADAYHALGLLSLHEGDATEALRQLRRAVDMHRQLATGLAHGKVLFDLAVAAAERREHVLALDASTKALDIFDKESFRTGVSQCLGMVAKVLLNQHRPAEARPFFERALRIREDLGDRRGVGEAVAALAHIALVLDQPDRALELARRAREIYAGVGEFVGAASALRTMGVAESALRRFESALTHLRDAVATYRGLGKKDAELCVILESLADCQESMGLQKDARETLLEGLGVAKELSLAYQVSHLEARLRAGLH